MSRTIAWLHKSTEEVLGFIAGGTVGSVIGHEILITAIHSLIGAVITGFISAFVVHYTKKLIKHLKL